MMKMSEQPTRAALVTILVKTIDFIQANKTLNSGEQIEMTINELIKLYPTFTIEDWRLCLLLMMKETFGQYFERLKLAQFVECFGKYDEMRQPIVHSIRDNERKDAEMAQKEAMRYIQPEYATEKQPSVRDRVDAVDWFKGENRLTYTERQEMDERLTEKK